MKIKTIQNKSGRELLKVSLSKKETFDYATASALQKKSETYLLPFSFDDDEKLPDLYYDLSNCIPLKTLVKSRLSQHQFESILKHFVAALDSLSTSDLNEKNLLFGFDFVFIQTDSSKPQLAYLPLLNRAQDDRAALDLLQEFAEQAHFITKEDEQFAQRFLDFIKQQSVFSTIKMQEFFGKGIHIQTQESGEHTASTVRVRQRGATEQTAEKGEARQTAVFGREFVGSDSGLPSRTQTTERRSVTESILAAVSEDFEIAEDPSALLPVENAAPKKAVVKHYWLVRVADEKRWKLSHGNLVVGRSKTCDIQVSDSGTVSRQHALLTVNSSGVSIVDKASSNGTFVNEQRLKPERSFLLQEGSHISLGKEDFLLLASTDG